MISIWHWHTEPSLVGGLLIIVWLYFVLVGPFRRRIEPEAREFPRRGAVYFTLAVITFYLAVGSPLDPLGENFLFSAHMVQHNILMYISPVLFILAMPVWLVDGVLARSGALTRLVRFWTHPLVAGFVFTVVFCGWHFPVLYEAALHDRALHVTEHLTMFGASVLMLWPILSRSQLAPRSNWGVQVIYIFLLMVAQIPLFGILTFSPEVLYPTYEFAPRVVALTPHEDQVLGGLIMKVANMVISLIVIGHAFYRWNEAHQRTDPDTLRYRPARTAG